MALIHSFESLAEKFRVLEQWAKVQNGKMTTYKFTIGAEAGEVMMHCHIDHKPSSSLLTSAELNWMHFPQTKNSQLIPVAVRRFDDIFPDGRVEFAQEMLLKLDVQGFGQNALLGGQKLITHCNVIIAGLVLDHLYQRQTYFYTLCELMKKAELVYCGNLNQHHGMDGRVIYADLVFQKIKALQCRLTCKIIVAVKKQEVFKANREIWPQDCCRN